MKSTRLWNWTASNSFTRSFCFPSVSRNYRIDELASFFCRKDRFRLFISVSFFMKSAPFRTIPVGLVFLIKIAGVAVCPENETRSPGRCPSHLLADLIFLRGGLWQHEPDRRFGFLCGGLSRKPHYDHWIQKRGRPTDREVNAAVYLLRCKQLGFTISELSLV